MAAASALDYLISFRDPTAERLIAPRIQQFIRDDLDRGGVLTTTLIAYFESNLNVTAMSKRLHIHANTAHHRRYDERFLATLPLTPSDRVVRSLKARA